MPTLLLIRHGESSGNTSKRLMGRSPGVHLTDHGRRQAEQLAERLVDVRLKAVYSSPLERCLETARPLAERSRMDIHQREGLIEVGFGDWTGRPIAQLSRMKAWRTVVHAPSAMRFPGGESFLEVQERAASEVRRIADAHRHGVVALFSHGDVIKLILAHFAGIHVDLFQRMVVEPASVSALSIADGRVAFLRMNDTGTLRDLEPAPRRPRRQVRG